LKLALICDTHAGKRSDNIFLLDHQKLFYDEIFFPYLQTHKIDTVFHLGDIVDRHKYINYHTLHRLRNDFLTPLCDLVPDVHVIAGNHDTFYKDRNDLNALDELLTGYPQIQRYIQPTTVQVDGKSILLLPWICRENEQRSFEAIKSSRSKLCFGHLQLQGFEQHRGSFAMEGYQHSIFERFKLVCSGHFHHKSNYDNIHYLGCPFQMDWGDYGDTKGFHILDTKDLSLTFISNPYSLFHKVEYDDKNTTLEKILDLDFGLFKKSFIRVVVKSKDNPFWFDRFMDKLEKVEPLSIQIIEDLGNLAYDGETNDLIHVEDTITLLSKYCDNIGVTERLKPKLNTLLQSLYNDANNTRIA
jgi:DNA repair exonuclease